MKVICAGFSKTGTKSIAEALRILGFKVYDYAEHYLEHKNQWKEILEPQSKKHPTRKRLVEMFQEMYKDVDAVTDLPACHFWEEILEAFPSAKVLLVIRDEKKWFKSVVDFSKEIEVRTPKPQFFLRFLASKTARDHIFFAQRVFKESVGFFPSSKNLCEVLTVNRYRLHNSKVLQRCPSSSLLIYRISESWKPLCEFLEVDMPTSNGVSVPFPVKNKADAGIKKWKDGEYPLSNVIIREVEEFKRWLLKYLVLSLILYCVLSYLGIFFH